MKNAKAKKKKSVLKLPELTCDELRKILRIRCKLVLNDFAEKKYVFRYTREKSEKLAHQERGGRKYLPPERDGRSSPWPSRTSTPATNGCRRSRAGRPCIVRGIVREGFKISPALNVRLLTALQVLQESRCQPSPSEVICGACRA